jgi:hypothetical protein
MTARIVLRLVALLLCLPPLAVRAAPPDAIKAGYDLARNGLRIATVQDAFERNGGNYRLVSESVAVGVAAVFIRKRIRGVSSGAVTAAGLRPEQFDYSDGDKTVSASFDWKAERVNLAYDDRKEALPLPQGTQDRLSLTYQFMFLPLDKMKVVPVHMTNGRKIESYRYSVAGSEPIETPLGKMNTVHLVKQRESGDNNQTEIWLATERSNVPVRILIVESDGTRYEQVISQLDVK